MDSGDIQPVGLGPQFEQHHLLFRDYCFFSHYFNPLFDYLNHERDRSKAPRPHVFLLDLYGLLNRSFHFLAVIFFGSLFCLNIGGSGDSFITDLKDHDSLFKFFCHAG
jgi:hypothetical protein